MGDFLAELFEQFDEEERARIREAEASALEKIEQGTTAVNDRRRASGSREDNDWVLQPEHDARADAAGVVFVAYVNALWRKTDAARAESIDDFLATVEKLIAPVLTRYGWEGNGLIDELHGLCRRNATLVPFTQPTNAASTTFSTGDSAADSLQGSDHADGHTEAPDATEQRETRTGESRDTDRSTIYFPPQAILGSPDSWRKSQRRYADLSAWYARQNGRHPTEAKRREELLKDARNWAEGLVRELATDVQQDVFELRSRVVKHAYDRFVPTDRHDRNFWHFAEFASALWEEGWPSLEDLAIRAILASQERAASSAAIAVSSIGAPLVRRAGREADSSRPQGIPEGAMADTEFWRRTAAAFRRLQPPHPQPGQAQRDSDNGLCARWNPDGWGNAGETWHLRNADEVTKTSFKWVARSAAVELGHLNDGSSLTFWLDLLRRDSPYFKHFVSGGYIPRVCDVSAEYCLKCETDAKAVARERARSDSTDDPERPSSISLSAWSRVKALNSSLKTQLNQGTDKDHVVCEHLQRCFDVLAEDHAEEGATLDFGTLRQTLPNAVLDVAVKLEWLPPAMASNLIAWVHREWLMRLLEGRIEYFEAWQIGRRFGRQHTKPDFVVIPVPETDPLHVMVKVFEDLKALNAKPPFEVPEEVVRRGVEARGVPRDSPDFERHFQIACAGLAARHGRVCRVIPTVQPTGESSGTPTSPLQSSDSDHSVASLRGQITSKAETTEPQELPSQLEAESASVEMSRPLEGIDPDEVIKALQPSPAATGVIEALGKCSEDLVGRHDSTQVGISGIEGLSSLQASARKGDLGVPGARASGLTPRRTPDLKSSRERLLLVDTLARELATVKLEVKVYCTPEGLKRKHPTFTLWTIIDDGQLRELVDGEPFTPKAYAEHLTLMKFGLTSRETLKKDRSKLRKAEKAGGQ